MAEKLDTIITVMNFLPYREILGGAIKLWDWASSFGQEDPQLA